MKQLKIEFFVGVFVISGLIAVSYLAIKLGDIRLFSEQNFYQVIGRFNSVSGLKEGAAVEMAGVKVGRVASIEFDPERFQAVVAMEIPYNVQLSLDSIASVRTAGIIGDKYIKITPGGDDDSIAAGDEFEQTESAVDIEELISKFVFSAGEDR